MSRLPVFSREFWRGYWIAIRRSGRDSRDRKAVLVLTLTLLGVFGYYGFWFFWSATHDGEILLFIFIFLIICLGRWIYHTIDEHRGRQASDRAVNKHLRDRIAADGFALSVLLARAGSEQLLREKELPPQIQIVTRQAHLAQLRQLSLWENLPIGVRDLLLMPDGHWPEGAIDLWRSFEILRCIRWALRLDSTLVALTHLPKMNYKSAGELIDKPERLLSSTGMLDIWDLRLARNQADAFFSRCYAEAIARGLFAPEDANAIEWANEVAKQARDPERRDTLVSHYTIAELNDGTLRYVVAIAFHRYHCLQFLINFLEGSTNPEEWIEFCFPDARIHQSS